MSAAVDFYATTDGALSSNDWPAKPVRHLTAVDPPELVAVAAYTVAGQGAKYAASGHASSRNAAVDDARQTARPRLRLTLRGKLTVALAVLSVGSAVLVCSHLSSPARHSPAVAGTRIVSVQAGDTLWSIAEQLEPNSDPRATVAQLVKLNHLTSAGLVPGERLRWR